MDRRQFLAASLATSAAALPAAAQSQDRQREHYLLRQYALRSGAQLKVTEHYFSAALIPALQRRGLVRTEYTQSYLRDTLREF